jgi:hypothetical protein
MTWAQLKLGSIDLTGSGYRVLRAGDGGMKIDDLGKDVPLRSSDGGRASYGRFGPNTRVLHIEVSGGGNITTAEANRDALIAELIAARNYPRTGTVKTYIEQQTGGGASTYKILRGSYDWTYTLQHVANEIEMTVTLRLSKA